MQLSCKNPLAAHVPRTPNLFKQFNLICPVQPRLIKYISSFPTQITSLSRASRPTKGRFAIVTNVRRDAVDATVSGAHEVIAGRFSVSDQAARGRTMHVAYGKNVWSWHPLLMSSRRRCREPDRVRDAVNPPATVTKKNSSPRRARHKPLRPLRRECRVFR